METIKKIKNIKALSKLDLIKNRIIKLDKQKVTLTNNSKIKTK